MPEKIKILIVEDHKEGRLLLRKMLESMGHDVQEAVNGKEGLEMARLHKFDLIISDILMPIMDGFQLCREVKDDENLKKIPFIFCTASYTDEKDEELALKLGVDRFIRKPLEPDELTKAVQGIFGDVKKGKVKPRKTALKEEKEVLKLYSERLVNQLEKKMLDLEREMSAHKQAEEKLRQSEQKLRIRNQIANIFLTIPDDEMYARVLEVVLEAMESKFGFFGYIDEKGSLVCPSMTRDIWDQCQVPDKDIVFLREQWVGIWKRVLMEGKPLYSNESFHVPEGHIPINSALSVPIILHGEVIGLLTVANKETGYDEKDLVFLESIAKYIAPVLHVRLQMDRQEKERKKLEAQLQQAQKMEALGTLLGGITHDFNNILSAILGYTELALEVSDKGSLLTSNLQEVYSAGKRARDLIQHILTFSRQTEHEPRPVQVELIVKEALKLLRASLPSTIEIRHDVQSDSAIMADPTQIHRVLMNLCTNASHAMQKDGGILEVNLVNVEVDADFAARHLDISPGPHLRLTVSDTGYGIAPAIMERIFDPYFTTKEKGTGTGMGLSVVNGIVKSHGGVITVYSEPGKGSAFNVFLPVVEDMVEAEREHEDPLPEGNERILFIDDESTLVDIGRQTLERLGYEVVGTTSSLEALELFKSQPQGFDLVITDTTMPQMTGDILAKEIMKIRPDIPIIMCTGYSEHISKERVEELGIRAFAMKPLLMRELATTVREVLDGET